MNINRFFFLILLISFFQNTLYTQSIATTRAQPVGSTVTVRGIVTNGAELGKIRYMQDGTAGIAVYPGAGSVAGFDGAVFPGDSIEVTGTMVSYHNLLEITPITSFTVFSTGNPLPTPKLISFAQISDEFESQLVEFDCVTFGDAGSTFDNAGSFGIINAAGEQANVYLRSGHPMVGGSIPAGPIKLRSIVSEYDDYQLLPFSPADFEQASCFFFSQELTQSDINTTGFKVSWQTSVPSLSNIRIGTTPVPTTVLQAPGNTQDHAYIFSNLEPGTVYWVQVESTHDGVTILTDPVPFATRSLSSGLVEVYFNHGIDPAFANGYVPNGEDFNAVLDETINRINAAQQTLDVAVYNNNRNDITNALKAAQARGVRVRYIAALDATNPALDPAPNFPVLYGNDIAIMHNKFLVADADIADKAWVMSGSLNWTNQNMISDYNNTLFIQDQALARAYRIEFEEMWGGSGAQPNPLESRFGSAKRDNTPHQFIVGGKLVESYFSPSDRTTSHIETVLRSAESEALFAAFSFTKNELGVALVDVHDTGVPVRGIMENISDSGAEYNYLLSNGVEVRAHSLPGEFHHKYGVVDAYNLSSDPTVVTGSHNWSLAAETVNDENTLVLHDPALAALFKAEFEKRWGEFSSSVQSVQNQSFQVFPNPTADFLELRNLPDTEGSFWVKNALGQVLFSGTQNFEKQARLNLSGLAAGQYFVTIVSAHVVATVPVQKI